MSWTRREFMMTGALASLSLPLIGGCQKKAEPVAATQEIIQPTVVSNKPSYFENHFGVTPEMIDKVLAKTMSRGGSFGDLFFEHTKNGSVRMRNGKVTEASSGVALGMGARCVNKDQVGYAYSESFELEDMLRAGEAAASIAPGKESVEIKPRHDVDIERYYSQAADWNVFDVSKAVALVQKIESQARAKSADIIEVTVLMQWNQRNIMINTSDGINAEDRQPIYRLWITMVMKRGDERQSNMAGYGAKADFESITQRIIDDLVNEVYVNTEILFHSVRPKAGEWPIVLEAGEAAILLHEAIGHGLEADFNRKDLSIFSSKLNQRVASDEVTIGDSGIVRDSYGAYNIDDEGHACEDTLLVENGILRGYLHDRISADHYHLKSTGNGRRESYKHKPIPRMRVTYMKNGPHEKEELLDGIKYGIYCSTFTNGVVNIGQGDYTFYMKNGYLIEDGKLTTPIKDVNLIGNGPDTLSKIDMVANNYKCDTCPGYCGKNNQMVPVTFGMPSIRVTHITVGGV